jgi:molybdopterin synthase sulfur carrier subunit
MPLMFFGQAQEIVGMEACDWQVLAGDNGTSFPTTAGELRSLLLDQFEELKNLSSLAIAVNAEYAEENTLIQESDEIALIPPVSGG